MTLTDEQCRRLAELLDAYGEKGDSELFMFESADGEYGCAITFGVYGAGQIEHNPQLANTPSAALLAALEKVK